MYQEAAPYLAMFEKIVKTSYSTKEDLRNDIRLLGKEHNVIMSIKSSKPTCIYYICKHGGHKRVRSDRGQTTNGRKSKKMLCDAFIQFNYDEVREDWTASRHHGLHNHSIPGNPAAYSINRKMSAELEEEVFADFKSGLTANVIYHALKSRKIFNITKNDLENLQYRFFSAERGKMMYEYITGLQDKGYEVYFKLDSVN